MNPIGHIYHLHVRRKFTDGQWGYMTIGYYTSIEEVEKAKARLRLQASFRDVAPDCFLVRCYRVNVEYDDPMFSAQFPPPNGENSD
jgi:hypothetical protein